MKYIKAFNNRNDLEIYKKSKLTTPHIFLNKQNLRDLDYLEEYYQLEYISSTQTGGQYIDLGCKLMENTDDIRMYIKFNIKGFGKNDNYDAQSTLIASQPEVSPYPGFVLRKTSRVSNYSYLQFIDCSAKWSFENSIRANNTNKYYANALRGPLNNEHLDTSNTLHKQIGNIYEETVLFNNIPQSQVNDCTCTLFCALDSNNNPFRYIEADLYYLKFIKGNTVIRNLVPVRRKSDNTVGLYDIEHDYLYVSQGDESFVAGPMIS